MSLVTICMQHRPHLKDTGPHPAFTLQSNICNDDELCQFDFGRQAGFRAAGLTGVNETNCSLLMKLRLLHPQGTFKLSHQDAGRARRSSVWLPPHRAVWVREKGTLATYQHFPKKKKILSYTASAGLIIGKNDAKGERGWKI